MQKFKGDDIELKFDNAGAPTFADLGEQKDLFFDEAYSCFVLGEILYDSGRAPLSNAIPRAVFREVFSAIFNSFLEAGGLESYLTVFRNIFGEDVEVTFTIPSPGKLEIDIVASGLVIVDAITRYIEDNVFVFDELVDHEGDNIAFQSFKGIESQYELEQMLFEMVPGGIYTQISLTIGGS